MNGGSGGKHCPQSANHVRLLNDARISDPLPSLILRITNRGASTKCLCISWGVRGACASRGQQHKVVSDSNVAGLLARRAHTDGAEMEWGVVSLGKPIAAKMRGSDLICKRQLSAGDINQIDDLTSGNALKL